MGEEFAVNGERELEESLSTCPRIGRIFRSDRPMLDATFDNFSCSAEGHIRKAIGLD
jgi:hypothetical protein